MPSLICHKEGLGGVSTHVGGIVGTDDTFHKGCYVHPYFFLPSGLSPKSIFSSFQGGGSLQI